ncbi:hypothetical protein HYC85_006602 [Camellia sinensis]|uniref:Amino acid transporter transmembrane domain-containing protein n=1 Tax=Camellia sinensis TaxID=4442 RepID=A0A7J7HP26_CAMSI|nr:hypothetical protein HYC85_006602 [Camellia sinensis]
MNKDEDFGPDRRIEFETDDEENQAERDCENNDDDDTDSDGIVPSPTPSNSNILETLWPQSFRQSMDLYTSLTSPSVSLITGTSLTRISASFLTSFHKKSQTSGPDSSANKPLISVSSLDSEEVPTSYLPEKLSATSHLSGFPSNELPPPQQQCSYAQSLLNAINVLCGIGLLSTPYALKEGGWWGLIILFILCIITCYTGILMKRCLESSPHLQTYPDIGQAAFGIPGRVCLAIILYIELYSTCVEYLIMMSDNLSALFPNAQMNFSGIHLDSYQLCTIISTLFILPTVWLRNLSLLSYVSVGGVLTAVLVSLCLLWVGVVDQVGFHPNGTPFEFAKLPVVIGLFGFCFGSHSVFPNIYSSMKEPSQFPSVLIASFLASGFLYAGVGICGFLMFGDSTKSQFTLNMPTNFVATKVAGWTTDPVMALIGSFLVMLVALIFPCACYLSICRDRLTKLQVNIFSLPAFAMISNNLFSLLLGSFSINDYLDNFYILFLQISVCIFIIIVGITCAIVGTYSAVTGIADQRSRSTEYKIVADLPDSNKGAGDDYFITSGNWEFAPDEDLHLYPLPRIVFVEAEQPSTSAPYLIPIFQHQRRRRTIFAAEMGCQKVVAKGLLASIPDSVDTQSALTQPKPKTKRIKKAQPKAKVTQIDTEDTLPISKLAKSDKSQSAAEKRPAEAHPSEFARSKRPRSFATTTSGSSKRDVPWASQITLEDKPVMASDSADDINVAVALSTVLLVPGDLDRNAEMSEYENYALMLQHSVQAEATIKAQTDAEEKAESVEAIKKVLEAEKKVAEEETAQAQKELQEALAMKDAELKAADEKGYNKGVADVTADYEKQVKQACNKGFTIGWIQSDDDSESEEEVLVRKPKDAAGTKSSSLNEQVLDLTQDEEGEEVPKDATAEKTSADVLFADKSLDETLQEIDAELAAEKAAEVSSQQSSELQTQPSVVVEES